jgi:opacity protein-like surface antigen
MKTIVITTFLLLPMLVSFGQEGKMYLSIDAGPSLVSIQNKENSELGSKMGFSAGVGFSYFLSENTLIKSGLSFERKGAKDVLYYIDSEGNPDGSQDIDITYDYLILPLLFAYHIPGEINLSANAGPYLGVLLSNMVYYEKTGKRPGRKEDFTSETNTIDFGLSIGIGAGTDLSEKVIIGADIRYNLGLAETLGASKNNSLGLLLSLKYDIR